MKEIKKVFGIVVLIVFVIQGINAQSLDSVMYKAYLMNSHHLWQSALRESDEGPSLQKAIAFYGLLNNTMTSFHEEVFDEYVDPALELLESMEEKSVNKAEAMALRSSIYGFIMAYSPSKGMYYGPKSSFVLDYALSADEDSPIVRMVSGLSLFYTPETFGGDKQEGMKALQKAVELYETREYRGWLYLNTLANLGQTYAALGQKSDAIATYEKALSIEPNFIWVSQTLLPKAKNM